MSDVRNPDLRLLDEALDMQSGHVPEDGVEGRMLDLTGRLAGTRVDNGAAPAPARNPMRIAQLRADLVAVSGLEPQARGYAFETFLKGAFNLYGRSAKDRFRLFPTNPSGSHRPARSPPATA